jgi:hypothetical protein
MESMGFANSDYLLNFLNLSHSCLAQLSVYYFPKQPLATFLFSLFFSPSHIACCFPIYPLPFSCPLNNAALIRYS